MTSSYLVTPGDFTQAGIGIALARLLVYCGPQRLGMKREAALLNTPFPSGFTDKRCDSARPHHHALSVCLCRTALQRSSQVALHDGDDRHHDPDYSGSVLLRPMLRYVIEGLTTRAVKG